MAAAHGQARAQATSSRMPSWVSCGEEGPFTLEQLQHISHISHETCSPVTAGPGLSCPRAARRCSACGRGSVSIEDGPASGLSSSRRPASHCGHPARTGAPFSLVPVGEGPCVTPARVPTLRPEAPLLGSWSPSGRTLRSPPQGQSAPGPEAGCSPAPRPPAAGLWGPRQAGCPLWPGTPAGG